jgi:hypothetical protein
MSRLDASFNAGRSTKTKTRDFAFCLPLLFIRRQFVAFNSLPRHTLVPHAHRYALLARLSV